MATAIEYGLIAALVAVGGITGMNALVKPSVPEQPRWTLTHASYATAGECYSDMINVPGASCEKER